MFTSASPPYPKRVTPLKLFVVRLKFLYVRLQPKIHKMRIWFFLSIADWRKPHPGIPWFAAVCTWLSWITSTACSSPQTRYSDVPQNGFLMRTLYCSDRSLCNTWGLQNGSRPSTIWCKNKNFVYKNQFYNVFQTISSSSHSTSQQHLTHQAARL